LIKEHRDREHAQAEMMVDKQNLEMINRKLVEDELRSMEHNERVQMIVAADKQYQISKRARYEQLQTERQI
jgi:hypothetical protein